LHPLLFSIIDNIRSLGWGGAFQLLRNGLVLGSLYALIALGYTMIYGILKLLNFAHGDVYMVGAFLGYGILTRLNGPLNLAIGIVPAIALMFAVAMAGSGVLGVAIERFAYRPLRNAPRIAPLITAIGVSFFLENSVQLLTNGYQYTYNPFELGKTGTEELGPLYHTVFSVAGNPVTTVQLFVVGAALLLMAALVLLV
jgi:branched-chain amino acid transport system permease protein